MIKYCRFCNTELIPELNWSACDVKKPYYACSSCIYEKYKSNKKDAMNNWRKNNPVMIMCQKAKYRAKKKGIDFNIDSNDISIPDTCPVLGIPISKGTGICHDGSPNLDRIDPTKGYVKGNIVVISSKANRIKNDATIDELEKVLTWYKKKINE